jgi:hypothetical protein
MLLTIGFVMLLVGVLLILLSLILMVVWKVPSLIDELSGRKAKRQIERMRKLNVATSGLTNMDTNEFYRSMVDASYSSNTVGSMLDNPYNVMSERVVSSTAGNSSSDDIATDLFDNSEQKGHSIKVLIEQTSLN